MSELVITLYFKGLFINTIVFIVKQQGPSSKQVYR